VAAVGRLVRFGAGMVGMGYGRICGRESLPVDFAQGEPVAVFVLSASGSPGERAADHASLGFGECSMLLANLPDA